MKPRPFQYRSVASVEEAVALLAEHGSDAKVLAGGQSLVPMMNLRMVAPSILVDIGRIDALRRVALENGMLRVGALVRHRDVEIDALVRTHAPLLQQAVRHVAHLAVRNRGTFGGSLCHADPAAEFPACAVLLEATMEIGSARGIREVAAEAFFESPFVTAVGPDEMLLGVRIPASTAESAGTRFALHELSRRHGDFAMSGVAARARHRDGRSETRWVAFGVSSRPVVLASVARLFDGAPMRSIADDAIRQAVDADLAGIESAGDKDEAALQRLHTAVLVGRCAAELAVSGRAH